MRLANHLQEAKEIVSPLLKSLIGKKDYNFSKEEVYAWDKSLGKFADNDTKLSLAASTSGNTKGQYYISIMRKDKKYDDIKKKITDQITKTNSWKVTSSKDRGNEGYWIYFTQK